MKRNVFWILLFIVILFLFFFFYRSNVCTEKVKASGPCEAILTGYEYDFSIDRCVRIATSGCELYTPFESMKDCRRICEKGTNYDTKLFLSKSNIVIGDDFDDVFYAEINNIKTTPLTYKINISLIKNSEVTNLLNEGRFTLYGKEPKILYPGDYEISDVRIGKRNFQTGSAIPNGSYQLRVTVMDEKLNEVYALKEVSFIVQ